MPTFKIKDSLAKITFSLLLILIANLCQGQKFPVVQSIGVNENLKLTLKIITIDSQHFIIPNLKVLSDTQNIQVQKEILYGNERDPIADCNFYLQKFIGNDLVNTYVVKLYYPDVIRELRKFTTKDSLTDTFCIEWFTPLEPGQYVVYLMFRYYKNGKKDFIYSDQVDFFVKPKE